MSDFANPFFIAASREILERSSRPSIDGNAERLEQISRSTGVQRQAYDTLTRSGLIEFGCITETGARYLQDLSQKTRPSHVPEPADVQAAA